MAKQRERFILTRLYRDEREIRVAFFVIAILIIVLIGSVGYLNFVSLRNLKIINSSKSFKVVQISPSPVSVSPTEPIVQNQLYQPQNTGPKEYFVSLGSGSDSSGDWQDVPGMQANINFGDYQNVKQILFEVSVNVPTANESVSVRLFNSTDQHAVWYSDVNMSGGASSYLVSSPVAWDSGSKTYVVQAKTQLKYPAELTQARLHIILQ